MAVIVRDDKQVSVVDGDDILEACKKLKVGFGCRSGLCGTCNIIVLEGMENLSKRSAQEEEMGLPSDNRLACQCKIKSGHVKIRY